MTNGDPKDDNGAAATGPTAGAADSAGVIAPDDPDYPKYTIRYAGDLVPEDGKDEQPPIKRVTIGPHGFVLNTPTGQIKIAVSLTHNASVDGTPDLSVTIHEIA